MNDKIEFKPDMIYLVKHLPSGEEWFILGVSTDKIHACAAGWPPTIGRVQDMAGWHEAGIINGKDKEYRDRTFGDIWL